MQKCYEHFNCKEIDCVSRNTANLQCWELEGTLCDAHSDAIIHLRLEAGSKNELCKVCSYYQLQHKG